MSSEIEQIRKQMLTLGISAKSLSRKTSLPEDIIERILTGKQILSFITRSKINYALRG